MDALVQALKDFITRDLLYVVGGSSVILSVLHVFCVIDVTKLPLPSTSWLLLGAGIAYALGYAIQDGLSILCFISTAPVVTPGRFVEKIYKWFTGTCWSPISEEDWQTAAPLFNSIANDRDYSQWNRIVSLKHIGATLGTSWLVTGLVLLTAAILCDDCRVAVAPALAILVTSGVLLCLAWVKGGQQSQFVLTVYQQWNNGQYRVVDGAAPHPPTDPGSNKTSDGEA